MWLWLLLVAVAFVVIALAIAWRPLRSLGSQIQVERARELFKLQRERLEQRFVEAASSTGKPRGLRWVDCRFAESVELAREKATGQLVALIGVTIRFEAIEGSDMEGVEAVSNLRMASAVFFFHRGHWETIGRAVFNMDPPAVLRHFHNQYDAVQLV